MLSLASDENFNNRVIRRLRRQQPGLDLVRVQDVGLAGANDEIILAWAAQEGRIVLTHDVKTIPPFAYARVAAGQAMPGVFAVRSTAPLEQAVSDLLLLVGASREGEWEGRVQYVPL